MRLEEYGCETWRTRTQWSVARETLAKLKGAIVQVGGRKWALNDVFRRPTIHIPVVCTID
jgi:hypothetical protein